MSFEIKDVKRGFIKVVEQKAEDYHLETVVTLLEYLLFVEVLGTELKLLIFGFHSFAQFLKDLKALKKKSD